MPLALAFLPEEALPISIGYDLGATLLVWSLGPMLIGGQLHGSQRLRGLLSSVAASPATRGLIGALLVQATPWSAGVADGLWWPSRCVIVLALMVVGMRLGSIHRQGIALAARPVQLLRPLVAKLLLYPFLLLLLASLLQFKPLMVQAVALQGAAPTAISLLLLQSLWGLTRNGLQDWCFGARCWRWSRHRYGAFLISVLKTAKGEVDAVLRTLRRWGTLCIHWL